MPVEKVCETCGGHFFIPPRRSDPVRFCSTACKAEAGWLTLTCEKCGNEFSKKKSDVSRSVRKYCSKACDLADRKGRKHAVDPDAPKYVKRCELCGVEFQVIASRKDKARFCSDKCKNTSSAYRLNQHAKQAGEKGWRWAGGLYQRRSGYVRRKSKKLDVETVTSQHRDVVFDAMIAEAPNHPFIVDVDGKKKLSPQIEVHHIDRVRHNNALDNLLAVTKYAHSQIHHRNRKPKPWECWPPDPTRW